MTGSEVHLVVERDARVEPRAPGRQLEFVRRRVKAQRDSGRRDAEPGRQLVARDQGLLLDHGVATLVFVRQRHRDCRCRGRVCRRARLRRGP